MLRQCIKHQIILLQNRHTLFEPFHDFLICLKQINHFYRSGNLIAEEFAVHKNTFRQITQEYTIEHFIGIQWEKHICPRFLYTKFFHIIHPGGCHLLIHRRHITDLLFEVLRLQIQLFRNLERLTDQMDDWLFIKIYKCILDVQPIQRSKYFAIAFIIAPVKAQHFLDKCLHLELCLVFFFPLFRKHVIHGDITINHTPVLVRHTILPTEGIPLDKFRRKYLAFHLLAIDKLHNQPDRLCAKFPRIRPDR